jgi:alpha-glucosidase (family GH31 glycosyl hydrolase)
MISQRFPSLTSPEGTSPRDLLQSAGFEQREVHDLYDHLMVLSMFGGLVKSDKKKNPWPFVLTRSFSAGVSNVRGDLDWR